MFWMMGHITEILNMSVIIKIKKRSSIAYITNVKSSQDFKVCLEKEIRNIWSPIITFVNTSGLKITDASLVNGYSCTLMICNNLMKHFYKQSL